jgi:hypothetical protein
MFEPSRAASCQDRISSCQHAVSGHVSKNAGARHPAAASGVESGKDAVRAR